MKMKKKFSFSQVKKLKIHFINQQCLFSLPDVPGGLGEEIDEGGLVLDQGLDDVLDETLLSQEPATGY